MPDLIKNIFVNGLQVNILVLGTGDQELMEQLKHLQRKLQGRLGVALVFDEALAHQLYAGSDFLFMPSRVEPCGLNQMYAMRYGTIPIVRSVGGLKDTVPDIEESEEGRGIRFDEFNLEDAYQAIYRATYLYYENNEQFKKLREHTIELDFSWEAVAKQYLAVYSELNDAALRR